MKVVPNLNISQPSQWPENTIFEVNDIKIGLYPDQLCPAPQNTNPTRSLEIKIDIETSYF